MSQSAHVSVPPYGSASSSEFEVRSPEQARRDIHLRLAARWEAPIQPQRSSLWQKIKDCFGGFAKRAPSPDPVPEVRMAPQLPELALDGPNGGDILTAIEEVVVRFPKTEVFALEHRETEMLAMLQAALIPMDHGEVPVPEPRAWAAFAKYDELRCAGKVNIDIERDHPWLNDLADDEAHPCRDDARLFREILKRDVKHNPQSLSSFLAERVENGLKLFEPVSSNPDCRTFNSLLPSLAVSTRDHSGIGRTLLWHGAAHMVGAGRADASVPLEGCERANRLARTVFSFPAKTASGKPGLTESDFDVKPGEDDPLDPLNVYELG